MSIYLDTCIVIYVVERHPLYSASIEALMRNAGAVDFCYTPLVRLECLVMPFRTNDTALLKLYEAFLGAQRLLDLPSAVFDEAARLRAAHQSLKTPDAIHLAAARPTFRAMSDEQIGQIPAVPSPTSLAELKMQETPPRVFGAKK